jgi:phage terminase Nu1 subunit (DNA packaging protein)
MTIPRQGSTADLAQLLGLTERAITKLATKRIFRRVTEGVFDLPDSVQAYLAYREGVVADQHGQGDFGRARAALFLERSRLTRLRREEVEGTLVPVAQFVAGWSQVCAVFRNKMLAIPSKLAPRLIGLKVAGDGEVLVRREIYEALEALADGELRMIEPRRPPRRTGTRNDEV